MKLQNANNKNRSGKLIALVIYSACVVPSMAADTFYVATNGVDAVGRGSEESPFETIQYAIDSASSGSTIWVKPGIYDKGGAESTNTTTHLNRVVLTKVIHLKSTDGAAVTHIVGAPDPDTGNVGPKAVRCIISPGDNKALNSQPSRDLRSGTAMAMTVLLAIPIVLEDFSSIMAERKSTFRIASYPTACRIRMAVRAAVPFRAACL